MEYHILRPFSRGNAWPVLDTCADFRDQNQPTFYRKTLRHIYVQILMKMWRKYVFQALELDLFQG